jgi:hypothetical protein
MKVFGSIMLTFWMVIPGIPIFGQESPKPDTKIKHVDNASNDEEGVPEAKYIAEITLDSGRVVTIHYSGQGKSNKSANVYFHRPIFAFVQNDSPINDYPSIVQSKVEDGGMEYLRFTLMVSSPEFRQVCAEQVRQKDLTLRSKASEINASSIEVRRWPLKQAKIRVLDLYTKQILSQGVTESLISRGDSWDFTLAFTNSNLKRFLEGASQRGRIGFVFAYTFENVIQQSASLSVRANVTIQQSLQKAFSSIKKDTDAPLFQDQYTKVTSFLSTDVSQVIRTTDSSLIPLLSTDWVTKLFDKPSLVSIDNLESTDKEFQKQAAEYIKPLIEKATEKSEENSKDTHHTSDKSNVGVKVSLPTGPSGSTEVNASKEALDEMTKEHGVTFTKQKDTENFVPHEIRVYRLSSSWQQSTMEAFQQVFSVTGTSASYFEDSPVSSQFTTASLKSLGDLTGGLKPFTGFWPGMMVCQLSNVLPPGFVWADGKSQWPDENWVPLHLRGKPVPDLSAMVIGSTTVESETGTIWDGGSIHIPALRETQSSGETNPKLYAMEYKDLPKPNSKATAYFLPLHTDGGSLGDLFPSAHDYLKLEEVFVPVSKYETSSPSVPLNNASTNPVNYRCRWIIKTK